MLDGIVPGSFFGDVETICLLPVTFKHFENKWYCPTIENVSHKFSIAWELIVEMAKLKERIALLVQLKYGTILRDASGEV